MSLESFNQLPAEEQLPAYNRRRVIKSNGKIREVWMPNPPMMQEQLFFLDLLKKEPIEFSSAATASFEGCSPAKNVERHAGNRYFFQLDLKSAYTQVDIQVLAKQFTSILGFDTGEMAGYLEQYCQVPGVDGLIMGAPTSPFLFNMYCTPLDEALLEYANSHGMTYTRYLDDLTFSSPNEVNGVSGVITAGERRAIREIIIVHDFTLNDQKTTTTKDVHDNPIIITGLQLNKYGNWQVTEKYLRKVHAYLLEQIEAYGIDFKETRDKAAGYKGLLVSSRQPERQHLSPTEVALANLIADILAIPPRSLS